MDYLHHYVDVRPTTAWTTFITERCALCRLERHETPTFLAFPVLLWWGLLRLGFSVCWFFHRNLHDLCADEPGGCTIRPALPQASALEEGCRLDRELGLVLERLGSEV